MVFGKVIKAITKNLTIISIGVAFVLGFIGMSDVKAVLLNPSESEDSIALLDTSTWFKKTDSGDINGEDVGLRIVSEIGLTDEEQEQLNNRGANATTVETDENGNPIDPSATTDETVVDPDQTSDPSAEISESSDETIDPSLSETDTSDTDVSDPNATTSADPSATESSETKTSETTKETSETTKETTTSEETETTTEAPAETTAEPADTTQAPETQETTAEPETTTTEALETTTEATTTPEETEPASLGRTDGTYDTDWAKTVLDLVNAEREANGLAPLSWSGSLAKAAKVRATEIVVKWSHTRPDGSEWWTVSDLTYGENLAYGQTSPSEVVEAWMNSSGHKANILGDYNTLGVACYVCDGVYYWVQEFGY